MNAKATASSPPGVTDLTSGSCLGSVPHQIRGFLAQFNNMLITGQAYDKCTACSATVVDAANDGADGLWKLVKSACDEEHFLEELTGLAEMYRQTEQLEADLEVDWSEDEGEI